MATVIRSRAAMLYYFRSLPSSIQKVPRMPLYVMLANFTGRGRRMAQDNPNLLGEAATKVETMSSKVLTQYAVLGRYDFVIITEAADNQSVVRLSLDLATEAGLNIETLPALPIGVLSDEEHISLLRDAAVAMNLPVGPNEDDGTDDWRIPDEPD